MRDHTAVIDGTGVGKVVRIIVRLAALAQYGGVVFFAPMAATRQRVCAYHSTNVCMCVCG